MLPHHPSCQSRCAGVGKGAATENSGNGVCLFGGVVCFVRFSVKFFPGPCARSRLTPILPDGEVVPSSCMGRYMVNLRLYP